VVKLVTASGMKISRNRAKEGNIWQPKSTCYNSCKLFRFE